MATVQVLTARARAAERRQGNGEVQTQINKDAILFSSPGISSLNKSTNVCMKRVGRSPLAIDFLFWCSTKEQHPILKEASAERENNDPNTEKKKI